MSAGDREYEYDVCLSFAGEQRADVEEVAGLLRARGIRVYYDMYEQSRTVGADLVVHLDHVYRESARYCVVFISAAYAAKVWPRHGTASRGRQELRPLRESRLCPG